MGRTKEDYGLPALTFDEAARILGITTATFREWILDRVQPSPSQWSQWKASRPLPEALIRLYLSEHLPRAESEPLPAQSAVHRRRAHR